MFTTNVPTYVIDLERDESKRWEQVIACEKTAASSLVQDAGSQLALVPDAARWVFAQVYGWSGGLYQGEIASWAEALEESQGTVTMLNCAYELSHKKMHWPKLFGCTAGVRWVDGLGMVHVRSLDWPLASMGPATRLFRFRRESREFVSVGVPGFVGVLSGMLLKAYSVTINWAPPVALPWLDFGPAFLLRDVLETCDTYDAAVQRLTETRLSTSVFFTVCGATRGDACVIERTQREAVVHQMQNPALVQANHHGAGQFAKNNQCISEGEADQDAFCLAGSKRREDVLRTRLGELSFPCTLDKVADTLHSTDVENEDTCQQMAFCPGTGGLKVWRRSE